MNCIKEHKHNLKVVGGNDIHIVEGSRGNDTKKVIWDDPSKIEWTQNTHICNNAKSYNQYEEVSNHMEDNKILEKYMDSVDRNTRDMESRINKAQESSENRMQKKYDEAIEISRQSEERTKERFDKIISSIEKHNDIIDTKIEMINGKLDTKISDLEKKIEGNNKFLRDLSITTIVGIAAMVISAIYMAVSIVATIKQIK